MSDPNMIRAEQEAAAASLEQAMKDYIESTSRAQAEQDNANGQGSK